MFYLGTVFSPYQECNKVFEPCMFINS